MHVHLPPPAFAPAADAIFPFVNGRCHLKQSLPFLKQSLSFITVVAISIHASSDKNAGVHENR